MRFPPVIGAAALAFSIALVWPATSAAAEMPATNMTENAEAAYARTLEKRVGDILAALQINDAAKSARVHDVLSDQYRALNTWHGQHDAELKQLNKDAAAEAKAQATQVQATLKKLHDEFLAKLSGELTPAQVETVKDKMTYGKVQFTYTGFLNAVPDMSEEEKAHVLNLLKEARELAMDGGSAEEKTAIFGKYKGKINNYLSSRGHNIGGKAKSKPAP